MRRQTELTPQNLIYAYCNGIFPMADQTGQIGWYEADPRGILPLESFHIPHDLKRILRQRRFEVTLDKDFKSVIHACANRNETTWISEEICEAYIELNRLGRAHSVEAWQDGELAGGLYGVAIGGAFFGESMFHFRRDASKVALAHLAKWLTAADFVLFDIQMVTDLLRRFGGVLVGKSNYLNRLEHAISLERELVTIEIEW